MTDRSLKAIILDFIHSETGWGDPLQPYSEFEDLFILEIMEISEGLREVVIKYRFDEDGFSQYDKSHTIEGKITVSNDGEIVKAELGVHAGIVGAASLAMSAI